MMYSLIIISYLLLISHSKPADTCQRQEPCLDLKMKSLEDGDKYHVCIGFDSSRTGCNKKGSISHVCPTGNEYDKIDGWREGDDNKMCKTVKCGSKAQFGIKDGKGCRNTKPMTKLTNNGIHHIRCEFTEGYCGGGNHEDCTWSVPTPDCPKGPAFCGGKAGIECEKGYHCVDDPTDDCDPDSGGRDCSGICVQPGDPCDFCIKPLCLCGLCPDGQNSFGCCGTCKYREMKTGLECLYTGNNVCPDNETCPLKQPSPGDACSFKGTCFWGEETCCGQTHKSFGCDCINGQTACFHTDACLGPCPDMCPAERPALDGTCNWEGKCCWGKESCCGETFDSFCCSCNNGQMGCYYTDACLGAPEKCEPDCSNTPCIPQICDFEGGEVLVIPDGQCCPVCQPGPAPTCATVLCKPPDNCYDISTGPVCCDPAVCETQPLCAGVGGLPCPVGSECVDDPQNPCDPSPSDCAGVCVNPNTGSECLFDGQTYSDGEIIGHRGTLCRDDTVYEGTQARCVNGEVIPEPYKGDCSTEVPGSKCCQKGTTAVCTTEHCDECPAVQPADFGATCNWEGACCWGTESCCGQTFDSFCCSCNDGQMGCYYTDACLGAPQNCGTTEGPVGCNKDAQICPDGSVVGRIPPDCVEYAECPIPSCVPAGATFSGDNDLCARASIVCDEGETFWSLENCGCGCRPECDVPDGGYFLDFKENCGYQTCKDGFYRVDNECGCVCTCETSKAGVEMNINPINDDRNNVGKKWYNGLSDMQLLLLNAVVSVITCLLVIAACLTCYYLLKKCNGPKYQIVEKEDIESKI